MPYFLQISTLILCTLPGANTAYAWTFFAKRERTRRKKKEQERSLQSIRVSDNLVRLQICLGNLGLHRPSPVTPAGDQCPRGGAPNKKMSPVRMVHFAQWCSFISLPLHRTAEICLGNPFSYLKIQPEVFLFHLLLWLYLIPVLLSCSITEPLR